MTKKELAEAIEVLVDKSSVAKVLDALAQVCWEKAHHVLSNYDDLPLAKSWERDSKKIDSCTVKVEN